MTTKERILATAIEQFNLKGYETVTLAELAELLGISRGNLAYHFKEKDLILKEIAQQIQSEIDLDMKLRKEFPAFSNLQIDIKSYHRLQQKYQFVFANQTVLLHAEIRQVMKEWSERTIQHHLDAFGFAVENGNMEKEPYPGLYHNLAINTWMIIYFWLAQKNVRDDNSLQDAEKMVWSTIIPHFTAQGITAFEKHFGAGMSHKLGKPFEELKEKMWGF